MNASLHLDSVVLRVRDLARSVDFYAGQLGFIVVARDERTATLAVATGAPANFTLLAVPGAAPAAEQAAGLFHLALLLPGRAELGRWLRFAVEHGAEFDGFSDHGVSEAIYFSDPDGNGLEFYSDRPRADWPVAEGGKLAMFTRALDVQSVLAAGAALPLTAEPLAGAAWGHIHLRVTELSAAEAFFTRELGLAVTTRDYPGALFLAADGYHHHIAVNTWRVRSPAPTTPHAGLESVRITQRGLAAPRTLVAPNGVRFELVPAA